VGVCGLEPTDARAGDGTEEESVAAAGVDCTEPAWVAGVVLAPPGGAEGDGLGASALLPGVLSVCEAGLPSVVVVAVAPSACCSFFSAAAASRAFSCCLILARLGIELGSRSRVTGAQTSALKPNAGMRGAQQS
jgi:hypothetical protein